MNILENIKTQIAEEINKIIKKDIVGISLFSYPPNSEMGDLSLPCFALAKEIGKNPGELAGELVGKIEKSRFIASVQATGPYLNFSLEKREIIKELEKGIKKDQDYFGKNKQGQGEKVMIEFSNANTHKEYHVGHLRNLCFGDAITKILDANGYDAIPVSYINDFGIHVAKTLWAYNEFFKNEDPGENKGYFLGKVYVRSSQEIKANPAGKDLVAFMMKKIESRQGPEYEQWKETRKWSIEQFDKIYHEMGINFKNIFYESEVIEKGRDVVARLYEKEILTKSEGAIIADLEKDNLGVLVVIRADGTALYPVADLSLMSEKFERYKLNKSIYVVDIRQGLYFKQLFKLAEKMGHTEEMVHLGYEFVKLPDGMMSSRSGNVITYEELRSQMMEKLIEETKSRHADWSDRQVKEVANKLAIGAIKFEMIKVGSDQIITFDIEKAMRFDGFTSAYIQYAYARIQSILRKSGLDIENIKTDFQELGEVKEHELVMKISKYPEIVKRAGQNYNPSEIAKYLFELAQMFNDYYHHVPVLKDGLEENIKLPRLVLLNNIAITIKNALSILGIEVMEEM